MPIYEYQCSKCGAVFEKLVVSASAPMKCDKCNGKAERQLSVFAAPPSSPASSCKRADSCPSAGGHTCGGGCGCGGHQ